MTIRVIREPSSGASTIGVVFVDDRFFSFSLEDELRERRGQPVEAWKVPGATAVPAGRYAVRMTYSPKFKRVTPELANVPGFEGIRIHSGNYSRDTEGCLLLGLQRAGVVVLESRAAVTALEKQIDQAAARGEDVSITIENPPSYTAA